jgi:hypothetical protein
MLQWLPLGAWGGGECFAQLAEQLFAVQFVLYVENVSNQITPKKSTNAAVPGV